MSALRSALDEMAAIDHRLLPASELDSDITELLEAQSRIELLLAEKTLALSDLNGFVEMGYPSATAYLIHRGTLAAGRARRIVSDAHAAEKAPATHRAWAEGRLSTDQARRLFAVAEVAPDRLREAEGTLVDAVEGLSVSDTHRLVEYWRQSVEGPNELAVESQMERRGLSMSRSWDGMRRVDGWLTSVAAAAIEAALAAHMPPPAEDDDRTPRQRRHDALEELARSYLDHGDTPQVGGEKLHIVLLADLDAVRGIAGGTHETLDGGDIVDVETLRMLACDSSISRIVLGPDSEILDVGRKTRVWTTAQRRAIVARDRHCRAPGCERPPRWCDIHHLDHWVDGGVTSVEKGKLLCRFHHVLEHVDEAKRRRP